MGTHKINRKIIGIEYEDKYNYHSHKYDRTILNTREKYFNNNYKGNLLSKTPDLKNVKLIVISDVLYDIYRVIDNIFYKCNLPKANYSNFEAYNCIKNKHFQSVTLDKFDIKFY